MLMQDDSGRSVGLFFAPEFKRNLRALSRKYRHIRADLRPVLDQLQVGKFVGDRIPGLRHAVFKVRVRNSDLPKGKSSGYRLIYCLQPPSSITLVTIYSKPDQGDIPVRRIARVLLELEDGHPE